MRFEIYWRALIAHLFVLEVTDNGPYSYRAASLRAAGDCKNSKKAVAAGLLLTGTTRKYSRTIDSAR